MISVIIPVYKVERYLDRCVQSVLRQTLRDFELLLIDDGSPDRCGEMCEAWAARDSRIRVFHKENGGLSDARNYGIERVGGDYITFVDSDDYVLPEYLEHLMDLCRQCPEASYVECGFFTAREGRKVASAQVSRLDQLDRKEALRQMLYHQGPDIAAWGKLFKREVFENLRFPVGHVYEEIAIAGDYRAASPTTMYSGRPLYVYVIREDSITTKTFKESYCRDHLTASEHLCQIAMSVSLELQSACRRFRSYSRMKVLREMELAGQGMQEWRTALRAEVLEDAAALLQDRNVPLRDKFGVVALWMGFRPYYWAWRLYSRFRG